MDLPCATCAAPCCVGRAVALDAADVRRLQVALGLSWSAFATIVSDEDGFQLAAGGPRYGFRLRHAGDGSCIFAVPLATTRRCGVHAVRPLSCRVYPWHVTLADDAAPQHAHADDAAPQLAHADDAAPQLALADAHVAGIALGNDAACPAPLASAWRARVDDERAALAAAIVDASPASDGDARARWNDA
ncbi:MAG TPA: YkgJ family cysteine cluster protein, partial [Polyangia bacterium]|nr:YkgJ family cysteine cluster protein [Polyangia bacterium]